MVRSLRKYLKLNTVQYYYMIVFVLGTLASIILNNLNSEIYRKLISCNDKRDYLIYPFYILCIVQCLLVIPKKENEGMIKSKGMDRFDHSNILFDEYNAPTGTENSSILNPVKYSKGINKYDESSSSGNSKLEDNEVVMEVVEDKSRSVCGYVICWDSVWTISFYVIFFLTFHSSLLASRIFGTIHYNRIAIDTCTHLEEFPLTLGSKSLKTPIISETVYMLIFLSFLTHTMCVRRTGDPYSAKHFFSLFIFKECSFFGILRLIVQLGIFSYAFTIIGMIMIFRTCPIIHIISGVSFGSISLWIIAVLSHLLQIDQPRYNFTPTLSFTWLWPIVVIFSVWLCGYLFYASVYGPCLQTPYPYIHLLALMAFLLVTFTKGSKIFDWSQKLTTIMNMG